MKKFTWFLVFTIVTSLLIANPPQVKQLKSLGFSMEVPVHWDEVSTEEFQDNLQRVNLGSPKFNKLLQENSEIPIISLRKGDLENDEYLTTVNVKIQKNNLEFRNIPKTLRKLLFYVSLELKNFDYLIEPKTVRINGNLAGYSLFSYSIYNEKEEEKKIISAVWIFPQKDYFYFIGTGIPFEDFEPKLNEIKTIITSVKIESKSH
ncbi:hypothetical protein [Leptospira levettii]|uniref:Uncharacterized protein n=2 Tax=Leptospira levettii TaxID=2023178 RepID=A0ABY2MRR5_9LEPT|nr:hypothetical protein [Leptospira levettii]PKA25427.1 hypothetical protein CH381_15405 [Leptospira sp. mixed culture ATI2-C-A1]TGL73444.1 hypothetical protein EHQ60_05140 [Leptospira levettii]TGM29375.1 hypothetical protein EHQ74_08640 [Leptospira levettii]